MRRRDFIAAMGGTTTRGGMRRRDFIAGLGAVAAWPLPAHAQQPAIPLIGYLTNFAEGRDADNRRAFRRGLSETGYVEGRNLRIEYRTGDGHDDRLPGLLADLMRLRPEVIAAEGPAARAARRAGITIPVVFTTGADPVDTGLVANLNRPGGNFTGALSLNNDLAAKRLELLHKLVPKASVVAQLVNPLGLRDDLQTAARILGLQVRIIEGPSDGDFDKVFAAVHELGAGALIIDTSPLFINEQLGALALRHGIPAITFDRDFVAAGGLASYGASLVDAYQIIGGYAGRILKGERPADLPVQRPTRFQMILNRRAANALGLEIPIPLLATADEVID